MGKLIFLISVLTSLNAHAGSKLVPVANVSILGGQYFLEGSAASFNGKAAAFLSPTIRLSENHDLVPVYTGMYNGTQDIQELVGGGVLTRQRQSHSASIKYVYRREFDKYMPRVSFGRNLTRETKNEKWGKGLFDYKTIALGIAAEHERYWGTVTEAYDFYKVSYPNYDSLLSQSQSVLDPQTFSELSQNSGESVLDNANHRLALGLTCFRDPVVLRASYDFTWRHYPDQAVVGSLGNFEAKKRRDFVHGLSMSARRDIKTLSLSLEGRLNMLTSNQNSYDASRTKYVPDYYGYFEAGLSPSLRLAFKGDAVLSFGAGWTRRFYGGRLAQDPNGAYSGSKVSQTLWLTSLSVRYPLIKSLFVKLAASYHISSSNMKYEANYRYNYQANNYLFGLEWEL